MPIPTASVLDFEILGKQKFDVSWYGTKTDAVSEERNVSLLEEKLHESENEFSAVPLHYIQVFTSIIPEHLAKSCILKSSPKYTCYMTNITSDVSRMSVIFTEFTYFPENVSEMHTSLHSTEHQLTLRYALITLNMLHIFDIILQF